MHDQAKTLIYSIDGNKAKKDKNPFLEERVMVIRVAKLLEVLIKIAHNYHTT
jgi:hypothetical protein